VGRGQRQGRPGGHDQPAGRAQLQWRWWVFFIAWGPPDPSSPIPGPAPLPPRPLPLSRLTTTQGTSTTTSSGPTSAPPRYAAPAAGSAAGAAWVLPRRRRPPSLPPRLPRATSRLPACLPACLQDSRPPQGALAAAITAEFKSLDALMTSMSAKSAAVQVPHRTPASRPAPQPAPCCCCEPRARGSVLPWRPGRAGTPLPPGVGCRALAGAGWATTRRPAAWRLPPAPTRTRWQQRCAASAGAGGPPMAGACPQAPTLRPATQHTRLQHAGVSMPRARPSTDPLPRTRSPQLPAFLRPPPPPPGGLPTAGPGPIAGHRRVGACILPAIQERAPRLPQSSVEGGWARRRFAAS